MCIELFIITLHFIDQLDINHSHYLLGSMVTIICTRGCMFCICFISMPIIMSVCKEPFIACLPFLPFKVYMHIVIDIK